MKNQNKKETEQTLRPGLLLHAKAERGSEVDFANELRRALPNVQKEAGTAAWFGFRINDRDFGTFDVFIDEEARQTHKRKREERERTNKFLPLVVKESVVINDVDIISYKLDGINSKI